MIPVVKYWPFRTNRNITSSQYEPKGNKGMNLPQEKNDWPRLVIHQIGWGVGQGFLVKSVCTHHM